MALFRRLQNRFVWDAYARKMSKVGSGAHVGKGVSVVGGEYIEIGDRFCAGVGLTLQAWGEYAGEQFQPKVIIGNDVTLTDYIQISCVNRVEIGDHVLMGQHVYISDNSHGDADATAIGVPPLERKLTCKGPVKIGNRVWIGRCVTIMSGVTVGDNAIIGANSVVTRDVPPNCVVAGVPARVIRCLDETEETKDC